MAQRHAVNARARGEGPQERWENHFVSSSDPGWVSKVVDRRASKGRKLRYNVHEKLVNFMVPVPHERTSAAVDQLFSGLFGGNVR